MVRTVERVPEGVRLIDQRKLPLVTELVTLRGAEEVAEAIRGMVVRGAPAIGCTAAFGLALAATQAAEAGLRGGAFDRALERARATLAAARPTAVNLFWALDRMARPRVCPRDPLPRRSSVRRRRSTTRTSPHAGRSDGSARRSSPRGPRC